MPTAGDAAVRPGARAVARYVRVSPTKARRVINLVRGLSAKEALTVLQFAPQAASEPVYKVLASAMANAENNERLDPDTLLVSAAFVDEGPTMKRFRPRAQGRAYRIRKRTSHITVVVESAAAKVRPVKKAAAKKAATGAPAKGSDAPAAKGPKAEKSAPAKKAAKKTTAEKAPKAEKPAKKAAAEKKTEQSVEGSAE